MKEIYYEGNLNKDIEKVKVGFNLSDFLSVTLFIFIVTSYFGLLPSLIASLFLGVDEACADIFKFLLFIPSFILSEGYIIYETVKLKMEQEKAKQNIANLSKMLNKMDNIKLSRTNILGSERIKKHKKKSFLMQVKPINI